MRLDGRTAGWAFMIFRMLGVSAILVSAASAATRECPSGFDWKPSSGVGCVQMNCFDVGAHWSDTQRCICGSGKRACTCPVSYDGFDRNRCQPGCPNVRVVGCVQPDGQCPSCGLASVGRSGDDLPPGDQLPPEPQVIPHPGQVKPIGFIKAFRRRSTDGKPMHQLWNGRRWIDGAGVETPLYYGNKIRTYSESGTYGACVKLVLFKPDGTQEIIDIRQASYMELVDIDAPDPVVKSTGQYVIDLIRGAVRTAGRRLVGGRAPFYIKTPTISTGRRGTDYIVSHDPNARTDVVAVLTGQVWAQGIASERIVLNAGEEARFRDGYLVERRRIDASTWNRLTDGVPPGPIEDASGPGWVLAAGERSVERPWEHPQGPTCFEQWTAVATHALNSFDFGPQGNAQKPWRINRYGLPAHRFLASDRAPDNWGDFGANKHHYMWANYDHGASRWTWDDWNRAGVPLLRPYVLQCIGAGAGDYAPTPTVTAVAPPTDCDSLAGTWTWFNGATVTCGPDGACEASNGFSGPWRCTDPSGGFEIRWRRGGQGSEFVDTFAVSPDGRSLTGRNQFGVGISAERRSGVPASGSTRPATGTLPGGDCSWQFTGMVSDHTGGDDPPFSFDSDIPVPARCHAAYAGNTATCWDGVGIRHPGSPSRAWCAYKHVPPSAYGGGGAPGKVYECRCP